MTALVESSDVAGRLPIPSVANSSLRRTVSQKLSSIDWNFPDRVTHSDIEGLHPYPAKFIAELPGALLDVLPLQKGTAVLDPFCGSGSTLVECQRRGIPSIGVDLNPIACLITRVKTAVLPIGFEQAAGNVLDEAQRTQKPIIPNIPNLHHWFERSVQGALAALTDAIVKAPVIHRDALSLALSSIIVRVSNQESDTRYAAIRKNVDAASVFSGFARACRRIHDALEARDYIIKPAKVLEADTLKLDRRALGRKVGLVITSPPYPNAYEYWLYHKYRMWWLGFDPLSVKEQEIGARAHFFKKNHHTADDFVRQMRRTFVLLKDVLVEDGHACFVVGRSRIHGQIVDNARIIEEVGGALGFDRVYAAERVLSATRKSFNLSHANIKTETVIVLRRAILCV